MDYFLDHFWVSGRINELNVEFFGLNGHNSKLIGLSAKLAKGIAVYTAEKFQLLLGLVTVQ